MRVWVTRAEPGAQATAARLRALGHDPLVASLLQARALDPGLAEPPADVAALAFTSANAVRAFAAWSSRRDWPVFVVGDATAAAARSVGFAMVTSAEGDVAALAPLIAAGRPAGTVLHPCAREAAGDLAAALADAGVSVRSLALYDTIALAPAAHAVSAWAHGEIDAVLLHSPKGARALTAWLDATAIGGAPRVVALGLSPACLAPLPAGRFLSLQAAPAPNETALLALLT